MPQLQMREDSLLHCLFVLVKPSADWMKPTHTGQGDLLHTVSVDSNANLFQEHLHDTQKYCVTAMWTSHGTANLTHKCNHHNPLKGGSASSCEF